MNKSHSLLLCLASLGLLASCGNGKTPVSSSSVSESVQPSSSVSSSEVSESSQPSSSSSSSYDESSSKEETPSILKEKFGDYEAFLASYGELVGKRVASAVCMHNCNSGSMGAERIEIASDANSQLVTTTDMEDGSAGQVSFLYHRLTETEYYEVEDDNTIYSSSARYKIGETDPYFKDVITKEEAAEMYENGTRNSTLSKMLFYANMDKIDERIEDVSYKFIGAKEGGYIEFDGTIKGSYFGSLFHAEYDLDAEGNLVEAYVKKRNYISASWDKEKGAPVEGKEPNSWFSVAISKIGYEATGEAIEFNVDKYYATNASGIAYHYYKGDMETGVSTEVRTPFVGDYIIMKQFDMDGATVSPATAIDLDTLFITASSNQEVIGAVSEGGNVSWKALKAGRTAITLGNSFVSNVAKVTVTVVSA